MRYIPDNEYVLFDNSLRVGIVLHSNDISRIGDTIERVNWDKRWEPVLELGNLIPVNDEEDFENA